MNVPPVPPEATTPALAELLDAIEVTWTDYVIFPGIHEAVALSLWVVHTYVIGSAECTPYIWVTSAEYESGKTRTMEVAKELCHEPLMASSISASALFRVIEDREPTLLLDEADAVFGRKGDTSESAETLRQILNAGYRRGNPAIRVVGAGSKMRAETFSTFSPKMIAGLKTLPDTLLSRCVEIRLHRKLTTEAVERFRIRKVRQRVEPLLAALDEWSRDVALPPEPESMPDLSDRQMDVWEPLLVIAEAAGGYWPQRAREAAVKLSQRTVASEPSLGALLLAHLGDVWDEDSPHMFTETILDRLHALDEAPWGDYFGRQFTARDLARLVKVYGVQSKTVRIIDTTKKGYSRDDLIPLWERYVGTPESASHPSHPSQPKPDTARDVTHVTHVTDFPGTRKDTLDALRDELGATPIDDETTAIADGPFTDNCGDPDIEGETS